MAKQSHNLRINVGSLKPQSGQARVIATGAPSASNRVRTQDNHNPKPGSAAVGPRQDGARGSSLRGSEPNPSAGPNVNQGNLTRNARGRKPS